MRVSARLIETSPFVILATAIVFKGFMIRNEERVLLHDPAYVEYANRVKYRVIPGII